MTAQFAFYSAGGYARETRRGFLETFGLARQGGTTATVVFIDDDPTKHGSTIHGSRVISYEEARGIAGLSVNVAFAEPKLRRAKMERCLADGMSAFSSISPHAIIGDNVEYGEGAIFSHNTIVTCDARIGRGFHCNIYSYVAHDCVVGDFVTLAPNVCVNGRVKIEDDVYIGTGAIVLPGKEGRFLTIGKGAVVGAGALVTKDVLPGEVVVGSPAKPLVR